MADWEREKRDALRNQGQPPIDPRHHARYSDVVDRMGVEWLERQVEDWERGRQKWEWVADDGA